MYRIYLVGYGVLGKFDTEEDANAWIVILCRRFPNEGWLVVNPW